jgi:hypothetical protein
MSPDLIAEFEHLDTRTDIMVGRVRAMSEEVQQTPVGKSFSPLKALDHMAVLEASYVKYTQKSNPAKLKGRKGKPNFFYGLVLKSMRKPVGKTSPTPKMFMPHGGMSIDESEKLWKERRAKLVQLISPFGDDDAAMKHPFLGYLSPRDIFILLEKHQDYHDARLPS